MMKENPRCLRAQRMFFLWYTQPIAGNGSCPIPAHQPNDSYVQVPLDIFYIKKRRTYFIADTFILLYQQPADKRLITTESPLYRLLEEIQHNNEVNCGRLLQLLCFLGYARSWGFFSSKDSGPRPSLLCCRVQVQFGRHQSATRCHLPMLHVQRWT